MTQEPKPEVLNRRVVGNNSGAVYVGRPSKFGNPFVMRSEKDRQAVVDKFRAYILSKPELIEAAKKELRGKDLLCFCSPSPCHADVLLEIANS